MYDAFVGSGINNKEKKKKEKRKRGREKYRERERQHMRLNNLFIAIKHAHPMLNENATTHTMFIASHQLRIFKSFITEDNVCTCITLSAIISHADIRLASINYRFASY